MTYTRQIMNETSEVCVMFTYALNVFFVSSAESQSL
jgi:hypothetical protein